MDSAKDRLIKEISELRGNADQKVIFKIGIFKSLRADENFLKSIQSPKSGKEQQKILKNIEEKCDLLIKALNPMRNDPLMRSESRDLITGHLIRKYFVIADNEKSIANIDRNSNFNQSESDKSLAEATLRFSNVLKHAKSEDSSTSVNFQQAKRAFYEPTNPNYPATLIEPIEKLRNAVAYAAKETKQGVGNSSTLDVAIVRKIRLAKDFIRYYHISFNKFPPKTTNPTRTNYIFGVYETLLEAADSHDQSKKLLDKDTGSTYIKLVDDYINIIDNGFKLVGRTSKKEKKPRSKKPADENAA